MSEEKDPVKLAQDRFQVDKEYWSDIYEKAKEDQFFLSDDQFAQWSEEDYQSRVRTGRPAITIDQLGQFVHQVVNDIRINTPTINVLPSGGDASVEVAEVYKGLIKNIEYASNADDAYDTAATNSVKSSFGFIRVDHEYEDEESFNQVLRIKRVVNPLCHYIDRESIEPDGSDAKHGTIIEKITVKEFKSRYPDKDPVSFDKDQETKANPKDDDYIYIAEHFVKEEQSKSIAVDDNGNVFDYQDGLPYKNMREVKKTVIKRFVLSGKEILAETTFPGKYIPLVPVYGEEAWIDGKRCLFSLIRRSKEAQRMYNYWRSLETELLQKAPQAPVLAAEGQVEDYVDDWTNPSKSMVLRYKTTDAQGNPIPPPQRLEPPTIPTGIVNAARQAVDDIKATMGLYNASIGARSNETSGIAIQRRQAEGDVATYHFGDNLIKSISQVGRILVCAIPEIYDTPRVLRILGLEDEPKMVGVNGAVAEGQPQTIDLKQGKYEVKVVTGASFTTQRQEAAQFFSDIVTKQPQLMNVMGDLLFKNMDFSGAQVMAERMKKFVDPRFLGEEEAAEMQQDPEKMQLQAAIQEGTQYIQELEAKIKTLEDMSKIQREKDGLQLSYEKTQAEVQLARLQVENLKKDLIIAEMKTKQNIQDMADQVEDEIENDLGDALEESVNQGGTFGMLPTS
jgi:hypothetical protein